MALQGVSAGWGLYIIWLFLSINKQNLAEKQKGFKKRRCMVAFVEQNGGFRCIRVASLGWGSSVFAHLVALQGG